MSVFELSFGLTAVILGLALTQMAGAAQQLALARQRVRWAPEPVLLATIIFLVIIQVWVDQWGLRGETSLSVGRAVVQVLKMLTIYFAAASVLPPITTDDQRIDLFDYYDRTRVITFGSLIAGLLLFAVDNTMAMPPRLAELAGYLLQTAIAPAIYLSLILVRWRPYNVVVLAGGLIWFAFEIANWRISQ